MFNSIARNEQKGFKKEIALTNSIRIALAEISGLAQKPIPTIEGPDWVLNFGFDEIEAEAMELVEATLATEESPSLKKYCRAVSIFNRGRLLAIVNLRGSKIEGTKGTAEESKWEVVSVEYKPSADSEDVVMLDFENQTHVIDSADEWETAIV